jgi:hypothetical protein
MPASGGKTPQSVGFLTVCEFEQQGLFGGYLVLNTTGRPLEFHCTAPVRPSRAQEILYGATLRPYLYGEQIGQTLLKKASTNPLVVFTDVDPALTVRDFTDFPVACVLLPDANSSERPDDDQVPPSRIDGAHTGPGTPFALRRHEFSIADQRLAVLQTHEKDAETINRRWEPFAAGFDLVEPFGRIREAIDEARRSAR